MGQYYDAIILGEKPTDTEPETIRAFVDPGTIPIAPGCQWGHGAKITEQIGFEEATESEPALTGSSFVRAVEALLAPGRMFHRSRLIWAGDYADCEPNAATATTATAKNLHRIVQDEIEAAYEKKKKGLPIYSRMLVPIPRSEHYRYVINHTKRLYVDVSVVGPKPELCYNNCRMHPLPLLVAEGNGRGGGDYGKHNNDFELCGTWARDVISVDDAMPTGFVELVCNFWD
jgi:hypothetical protein